MTVGGSTIPPMAPRLGRYRRLSHASQTRRFDFFSANQATQDFLYPIAPLSSVSGLPGSRG